MDLFDKLEGRPSPLGEFTSEGYGYYTYPKLEGPLGREMKFNGKDVVVWSINDYLGVGSNEEMKKYDAEIAKNYSLSSPMGARLMIGNSTEEEQREEEWTEFVDKPNSYL